MEDVVRYVTTCPPTSNAPPPNKKSPPGFRTTVSRLSPARLGLSPADIVKWPDLAGS